MNKRITQQHYDAQARIAELEEINAELVGALAGILAAHAVPSSICKERPAHEAARAALAKAAP